MKKAVIGLFAHVDAGKTTLSEALLYNTGNINKLGRVDSKNTFLDFDAIERDRGITVFSKQAIINYKNCSFSLLDTPGHIDFSSEAERTVQVLDYAVLIISSRDGIQAHTETLWNILKKYQIPTFIFINKMDLGGILKENIINEIRNKLSNNIVEFSDFNDSKYEDIALCDEKVMEEYLSSNTISKDTISNLVNSRKLFPCFFGSALKNIGVNEFINEISEIIVSQKYGEDFSARVYKITRDKQGNRLTHLKITGGKLGVKSIVSYFASDSDNIIDEKINMIRKYSGEKFETIETAESGDICAVTGLTKTFSGQGLGKESEKYKPVLEPVMSYDIILPEDIDTISFLPMLKQLEEEDPQLNCTYNEIGKNISIHLMGDIQAEIFKKIVYDRFNINIGFKNGKIMYKETIVSPCIGIGHYEPLKHYAEVHLLIEPSEPGTGITAFSNCNENVLDKNWQHLVINHIKEKTHIGVLIGAPLTDVKISVVAGRSHIKHTEGGDFRQATYRAIRQGLMKAQSIILEPYYLFELEVPASNMGRSIIDIKNMGGNIISSVVNDDFAFIKGRAPVSEMQNYYSEVLTYTKGAGKLSYISDGYRPCHNQEQVIKEYSYSPEADVENTPDSVFCSHGVGVNIKRNDLEKYMHVSSGISFDDDIPVISNFKILKQNLNIDEKELEEIMEREFGPIRRKQYSSSAVIDSNASKVKIKNEKHNCIIIDGYNLIGSWKDISSIPEENMDIRRHILMELLANYNGYIKNDLILVFDGYNVKDNIGEKYDYHGIHVVYTKENETADMYIERLIDEIGKNYNVKVVTSDNMIQIAALKSGVLRMSSREFTDEILSVKNKINDILEKYSKNKGYKPFEFIN